jgi:hypothetical protein
VINAADKASATVLWLMTTIVVDADTIVADAAATGTA